MDSTTFNDVSWMPCLGRKLKLGSLYDCCTNQAAIGKSIWDEKSIQEAQVDSTGDNASIEYSNCECHNIDTKASFLEINEELYLSCAADPIKLGGEAKFFSDQVLSKNFARMALKCCSSSKVIQLDISKLGSVNIKTFEQESSTHIITGMQYGAISIIVCDQKIKDRNDIKAAYENLKTKIHYLERCISGNFTEMLSSMESNSENITCKVFSTLNNIQRIETYTDAIKFCRNLAKLHTDNSVHIPIRVSLFPLKKINTTFTKNAQNISETGLIKMAKSIHDTIINISLDLVHLQGSIDGSLPCLIKQMEAYHERNINIKADFTKILGGLVPKYRKGDIEEYDLKKEIEVIYNRLENLSNLVQNKLKEVQQICTFMKAVKGYDLIAAHSEIYYHHEHIICLEFNTSYLTDFNLPTLPWHQDKKAIAEVRYKIKQFLKFAKEHNEGIKFAVCEFSDQNCKELVVIKLYSGKDIMLFEPPTPPSKPLEIQKTESSVTLAWSEPQCGAQLINCYNVHYCKIDDDKWKTIYSVKCSNNTTTIETLEENTGYQFKISATTKISTTIESQISETVYTAKSVAKNSGKTTSVSRNKSNPNKGTTPIQDIKKTVSKTGPQKTETHCQDTRKSLSNPLAAHESSKKLTRDLSVIKSLHEANKCEQLSADSLSKYKLKFSINKLTDIEIFNFGKRNEQLPEKVILIIGATGAGKTTLINGMVNYIYGVKWKDPERAFAIEKHPANKRDATQALSQTKSVNVYKFNHNKHDTLSHNLTIIDTPGFADADGLKRDEMIMIKIKSLLTSDKIIDHIDAVCFVVQAPLSRLSPTQSYVINSVYSLFGRDVADSIFILATFADVLSSPHVLSALDEAKIQYNKIFKFNNSALYANTTKQDEKTSLNESLWKMGMESFNTFFSELESVNPVSLTLTKDLLNERKTLQALLEGLHKQINYEFMNMQKLKQQEKMLTTYKNEAEENENFKYQEFVIETDLTPSTKSQLATNCHKCKNTCHEWCYESADRGRCLMMSIQTYREYKCSVCKCSIDEHETSRQIYHHYIGTETKTIKDMKQKYDKAQNAQLSIEKVIDKIIHDLENVRKVAREKLFEMHKCIQRINEISLQPNLIEERDYILTLIASEKAEQTEGYTTRLEFYQKILKEFQPHTRV